MIKIGIVGYGNLGKGVEKAVSYTNDMELTGIFTRRDPESVNPVSNTPVYKIEDLKEFKNQIDVLILCGGSATDLPKQTPELAAMFNVVDSFDTHANIPVHFKNVNKVCLENGTTAIISIGWDPGLFSLNRLIDQSVLPNGKSYTFWGKGVSQGHSDAIRRIKGVVDARQYTIPVEESLDLVRSGVQPELSTRQKHTRECFVVAEEGADLEAIREEIVTMPNYFDEYDTTVNFISQEELNRNHSGIPHGGFVVHTGNTGENKHTMEFSLTLDSNPEFTSSVLVAYARACYKMNKAGIAGCQTIFDVPPVLLSEKSREEIIEHLL